MTTSAEALSLGTQHQQAGNWSQAEALFRQVLDADPHDANALFRLATVCQLQGHTAEAIVLYQQLLEIKPDAAKVHNNLGLAYVSIGKPSEGLHLTRKPFASSPILQRRSIISATCTLPRKRGTRPRTDIARR